ncbi:MAG: glycosyltransferase family 2 protein [Gallionella sp.]|nr:glycosyltransferase family 2 protein [Gallionella sp.]
MRVALCIPTLNAGNFALQMVTALKKQRLQPDEVIILDSESSDGTVEVYRALTDKVVRVNRKDFDHGGTRNLAFKMSSADIIIFMTQDAIPVDVTAIQNLVQGLVDNPRCGLVYGRQMADAKAGYFARHARTYNYPSGEDVILRSIDDVPRLGIKAAFCSDSFAAYRRKAMEGINYFDENTLFAEDSIAAAKLLKNQWQVAYVPQARVVHSHDYSLKQDFCRYFDVGAFHSMNQWYMDFLGKAEGEGMKFVRSEYAYLKRESVSIPFLRVLIRNFTRWLGYRVGRSYTYVPLSIKLKMSTNKSFWLRSDERCLTE